MTGIIINNEDFYIATEWRIINAVREVEKSLRGVAFQAAADVGIKINHNRVVEGYYGMPLRWNEKGLDDLKEYFFAIKSLQEGTPAGPITSSALQQLDDFYHSTAFGLGPERPTAFYAQEDNGWNFKEHEPRFLSGIVDGVYLAMKEKGWNSHDHNTQAIVQRVIELQHEEKLGTNLVALAALVDDKEHRTKEHIDPVCLTYAMFTTVLSRTELRGTGPRERYTYQWNVDPQVEALGEAVINAYNQAFTRVSQTTAQKIVPFYQADAESCSIEVHQSNTWIKRERIVRIGSDPEQGKLHWAVRRNGEKYSTFTFTSPDIVNPIEYSEDSRIIDQYNPQPAVKL
ncbi:MAG: hypothetical protein Q7K45_02520 [Nanoarchaeota archaeon]|nr:hypothetical protein [Nanoarchaeota archaeon]